VLRIPDVWNQSSTEKIPTSKTELDKLKKDRDTASLGMGRMYESFFGNTKLATKTLYDLVDNKPDEETDLLALYNIFIFNYEKILPTRKKQNRLFFRNIHILPMRNL
jgi:hypothetical protein